MKRLIYSINLKRIGYLLGLTTTTLLNIISPGRAQVDFLPTPPDQGAPTGRQRGGATRGSCINHQGLTALIPEIDGAVWSKTTSATPDFFFYLPNALDSDTSLELVIQAQDDSYVFRKVFSINTSPGILLIPISSDMGGLEPEMSYAWTFSIYCDAARPSASVSVSGTIKRTVDTAILSTDTELAPQALYDLAKTYAAEGIWHEALSLMTELHSTEPDNVDYRSALESLFAQAGLSDISPSTPIISPSDF
ncbi:MAG: DUF928 domain-containing protein [Cyanobacteria bacterium P01_A01_bin.15]